MWFVSLLVLTVPVAWVLVHAHSFSVFELTLALPTAILAGAVLLLSALHLIYRAIPAAPNGQFELFKDWGSILWAVENSFSIPCLRLFQGTLFVNEVFRFAILKALRCNVTYTSWITSRTVIANPRKIFVGERCIIGEFAHLCPSLQPRVGRLLIGEIHIGNDVLVGGYCRICPDVSIGNNSNLQAEIFVSYGTVIGNNVRIGARSILNERVKVGNNVRIGKDCRIEANTLIPDGTIIPNGTRYPLLVPVPQQISRPVLSESELALATAQL